MVVIKRDGREVDFDKSKIYNAVYRAFEEVEKLTAVGDKEAIAGRIADRLEAVYAERSQTVSVESIQDDVETELMREGEWAVAKAYIKYRYEHELLRNAGTVDGKILSLVDGVNETVIQENSNKNPAILSTQRDYIAGEVSRDITDRLLLPEDIRKAHEEGIIHFHDSDYFIQHSMNCFSSKTRFVTDRGVISFAEAGDGAEVNVLDCNGSWRKATVHKYGKDILYDVTLQSARSTKTVTCTANHRWLLADGTITTNLSVGDTLYPLRQTSAGLSAEEILSSGDKRGAEMFALGFMIGDGSDFDRGISGRLCGGKTRYAGVFRLAGYTVSKFGDTDDLFATISDGKSKQDFLIRSLFFRL